MTKRGSDVPFATSEEAYALSRNDSVTISKPVHGSDGPALPRDEKRSEPRTIARGRCLDRETARSR